MATYDYRVFPELVREEILTRDTSPITLTKAQRWEARGIALLIGIFLSFILTTLLIAPLMLNSQLLGVPAQEVENYVVQFLIGAVCLFIGLATLISSWLGWRNIRKMNKGFYRARDEKHRRLLRSMEEARGRAVDSNTWEAKRLTTRLNNILESSHELNSPLFQKLNNATRNLGRAESEYSANAYGPFWDAVQDAANDLAFCSRNTKQLSQQAKDYYSLLKGRQHNFPVFPVRSDSMPDVVPVGREFRRIVRMGQTNFQFAHIWEQRATREVLIAGFQTLGDAVNHLSGVVEQSVWELQSATSSEIAKLVDEEITTRANLAEHMREETRIAKDQSRMLDNIQRHRKPTP